MTATQAPAFRPFSERDWARYAGCNTDHPEIATTAWGLVILDGAEVYVETHDRRVFVSGFDRADAARLVAERVLALASPVEIEQYVQAFDVQD